MKRTVPFLLSMILFLSLVSCSWSSAQAAPQATKLLTGNMGASLRSSPEILGWNKICGIHADTYLDVYGEYNGWYYVKYNGVYGWVNASPQIVSVVGVGERVSGAVPAPSSPCVTPVPNTVPYTGSPNPPYLSGNNAGSTYTGGAERYPYLNYYDIGVPQIGGTVFTLNQMNLIVLWVQTQLKATGIWYQGTQCELNGNLGENTMSEIRSFMAARGYYGHTGIVDQNVLNALANELGSRIVPVYSGGFYSYMNSILYNDPYGSMSFIVSNLRDMAVRETVGARWVQVILSGLGYYTGPIDGQYGKLTQDAVILFQRCNGFQERDYVSLGVARAMLEQYYRLNKDLRLLP